MHTLEVMQRVGFIRRKSRSSLGCCDDDDDEYMHCLDLTIPHVYFRVQVDVQRVGASSAIIDRQEGRRGAGGQGGSYKLIIRFQTFK